MTSPRPRLVARALEQPPLGDTAHIRDPRHCPERLRQRPATHLGTRALRIKRLPHDRERLHRLRDPLQFELPGRLQPSAVDPAREQLGSRRHQDPVDRRFVAQSGRLDRRHPEVIPFLDRCVARAQPDPHGQRLLRAPIAALEQLLRQHRTTDCSRRRRERHEQSIARLLELLAARRLDRFAQQREVLIPKLIRPHRSHNRRQPCRPDQIDRPNRRQLNRSHTAPYEKFPVDANSTPTPADTNPKFRASATRRFGHLACQRRTLHNSKPPAKSVIPATTRRRNRTFQAGGCPALPVLKTGWATRPLPRRW
jgi:hypothetical protein